MIKKHKQRRNGLIWPNNMYLQRETFNYAKFYSYLQRVSTLKAKRMLRSSFIFYSNKNRIWNNMCINVNIYLARLGRGERPPCFIRRVQILSSDGGRRSQRCTSYYNVERRNCRLIIILLSIKHTPYIWNCIILVSKRYR